MIPLFGDILSYVYHKKQHSNKFLLAVDKFMPTMHLIEPGFAYSTCGPFTKTKSRPQKIKRDRRFQLYLLKWTRFFFQHKRAYRYFKDLPRKITSGKALRDKALLCMTNINVDLHQKISEISGKSENQKLENKLHESIIKIFRKQGVYSSHGDNMWGTDQGDMQLLGKDWEKYHNFT